MVHLFDFFNLVWLGQVIKTFEIKLIIITYLIRQRQINWHLKMSKSSVCFNIAMYIFESISLEGLIAIENWKCKKCHFFQV